MNDKQLTSHMPTSTLSDLGNTIEPANPTQGTPPWTAEIYPCTFTLGDCACMHGDCACMPLCYGIQIFQKPIQIIQHLLPAHVANASVTVAWCKNHYL